MSSLIPITLINSIADKPIEVVGPLILDPSYVIFTKTYGELFWNVVSFQITILSST